jgi:hypothetical protein
MQLNKIKRVTVATGWNGKKYLLCCKQGNFYTYIHSFKYGAHPSITFTTLIYREYIHTAPPQHTNMANKMTVYPVHLKGDGSTEIYGGYPIWTVTLLPVVGFLSSGNTVWYVYVASWLTECTKEQQRSVVRFLRSEDVTTGDIYGRMTFDYSGNYKPE